MIIILLSSELILVKASVGESVIQDVKNGITGLDVLSSRGQLFNNVTKVCEQLDLTFANHLFYIS